MSERRTPSRSPTDVGGEYAALDAGAVWPLLALALFVAALGARFLVDLVPGEALPWPYRLLLPGLIAPAASLLGLLCAWRGLKHETGAALARLALFLNGVALCLSLLAIAAFFLILP